MHSNCLLVPSSIAPGFNFAYEGGQIGTALLPPKNKAGGGMAPYINEAGLTPNDIDDIQKGRKFFYFSGWARYHDVFPNTDQHITRFAWQIVITGDPFRFDPSVDPQGMKFANVLHFEGNCADDECQQQGPNKPEAPHVAAPVAFAP